jgi:regulator of cell morphogenesis and NO signaling
MNSSTTLAELAVTHPAAARIFYQHRLDFCCGGKRPLADACRDRGLDSNAILEEITAADPLQRETTRWDEQPLSALVDHIVRTYHARLRTELPVLIQMARKVEARHGDKAECPRGLGAELSALYDEVIDHLAKEEQIVFPMIASGMRGRGGAPVRAMEAEHEHHREHLVRLRSLTSDLTPPAIACATWRALYLGLQQLEQELMTHIHLENNVLFPRALRS